MIRSQKILTNFMQTIPAIIFILFILISKYTPQRIRYGGCFDNTVGYGWPYSVYTITTKCFTCCSSSDKLPKDNIIYSGIIIDILFYLAVAFLLYKIHSLRRQRSSK